MCLNSCAAKVQGCYMCKKEMRNYDVNVEERSEIYNKIVNAHRLNISKFCAEQRSQHLWKDHRVMTYRFAQKTMQSKVTEAYLHVHLLDRRHPADDDDQIVIVTLNVTRVVRAPSSKKWSAEPMGASSVGLTVSQLRAGHTVKLDVTEGLEGWLTLPRTELSLAVAAHDGRRRRIPVPPPGAGNSETLPYLEVHVDDDHRRRSKRAPGDTCRDDNTDKRCCRYPLTVDFEEFGWDWVIAPKRYEANFCMGECPYAFLQRYPNTHVVHLASPPGYRGPCCTPRKVSPISLLHFDHELNIVLDSLPDMVVEKCACN